MDTGPVHPSRLRPASDASAAAWLAPRLRRFGSGVAAVVPDGFEAYARILHPAESADQRPTRWDAVAAQTGRVAHRLMQFEAISSPDPRRETTCGTRGTAWGLALASSRPTSCAALCEVLARHTATPATCSFCVWEGYAWVNGHPGSIAVMQAVPAGRPAGQRGRPANASRRATARSPRSRDRASTCRRGTTYSCAGRWRRRSTWAGG